MAKARSDDLRPEYRPEDLGLGIRGEHFHDYRKGTNLVLLSPEVARAFPTDEAVNNALRSLIEIAQHSIRPKRHVAAQTKKRAVGGSIGS